MINLIKNNLTIRRGFIIGVTLLVLFNILFIMGYYRFYLDKVITEKYQIINNELETELSNLKEELMKVEDYNAYLNNYIQDKDYIITLSNSDNELVTSYSSKRDSSRLRNNITVSQIINLKDEYYIISLSNKRNVINLRLAINFLIFELFNIIVLAFLGIYVSNIKLLSPITDLSKDLNNYKLGIVPNKRHKRGEIDILQNDFVDLVENLEEEKKKQNRIIASISHDIKTPLTSILGYSERLIKNPDLPNATKEKYHSTIYAKALSLKEIVEEFDDYLSCNIKDETKTEKISIKYIVDYLDKYYKEDLKEKNIDFKIKTNCPNAIIEVDLAKWKRIFSNTITNSLRYFNSEKKILIININEQKDDKIIFEIADNGTGCTEILDKIFEPLYTTDKSRKISGLGLSICKEIVESHNGTIKACNNKMGGLSIIFTIDAYKE